jgi:hypothetical protein
MRKVLKWNTTKKQPYAQAVVAEPYNGGVGIEIFVSSKPISLEMLVRHYEEVEGFNWEKDSITMVDFPETATLIK